MGCEVWENAGGALRAFRGARPLLPDRGGLVGPRGEMVSVTGERSLAGGGADLALAAQHAVGTEQGADGEADDQGGDDQHGYRHGGGGPAEQDQGDALLVLQHEEQHHGCQQQHEQRRHGALEVTHQTAPSALQVWACSSSLTRSRNSLPGLKCGTYLPSRLTDWPVFGLRPTRGER